MSRHKSKAIPGRNLRLADQIQKDLAGIIQREIDTTRAGLITLSGVELSTDYAHAKVYFTVLGAEPEAATALLNEKAGWLHSQLYKLLHIHTVPTLRFFHDEQIARGIEMSILIDRANRSGPIRACLTNLKTSPDRAVVAASTFRIPTMAKRRGLALDGVLLLDKPVGLSSNHACSAPNARWTRPRPVTPARSTLSLPACCCAVWAGRPRFPAPCSTPTRHIALRCNLARKPIPAT